MSEMSMQEKEYKIAELLEVSKQYSEAEATRQYLMEFRKSKKAILMAQAESATRSNCYPFSQAGALRLCSSRIHRVTGRP